MRSERWRAVVGCEMYLEVSTKGRVRSLTKIDAIGRCVFGKLLSPRISGRYMRVRLRVKHVVYERTIHQMVLEAFVGPRPVGIGMQGCHRDDDPYNNGLDNLRWDTPAGNKADSIRRGTAVGAENFRGATGLHTADGRISDALVRWRNRPKKSHEAAKLAAREKQRKYRLKEASDRHSERTTA